MPKLFTESLRNEPQKQTEIGSPPDSWVLGRLNRVPQRQQAEARVFATWRVGDSLPTAKLRDGLFVLCERGVSSPRAFGYEEEQEFHILRSGPLGGPR